VDIQLYEASAHGLVDKVVVKIQKIGPKATLHREIDIYKALNTENPIHLPLVFWLGTQDGYDCIVMRRYEINLRQVFSKVLLWKDGLFGCLSSCAVDMV